MDIYLCKALRRTKLENLTKGVGNGQEEYCNRNARTILESSMVVPYYQVSYDAFTYCMTVYIDGKEDVVSHSQASETLFHPSAQLFGGFEREKNGSVRTRKLPPQHFRLIEAELLAYQCKPAQAVAMYLGKGKNWRELRATGGRPLREKGIWHGGRNRML